MNSTESRQIPEDMCDIIVREAYGKVARDPDTRIALEMWDAEQHSPNRNEPST